MRLFLSIIYHNLILILHRIKNLFINKYFFVIEKIKWVNIPSSKLIYEVPISSFGGSSLLVTNSTQSFSDPLIICLQSAGMFKSDIHKKGVQNYFVKAGQGEVFCLTASNYRGEVIWQIGNPFKGPIPYLSHSTENMMKLGDVNGDGIDEIIVLDGNDKLLIISLDGKILETITLPNDSFSQVYFIRTGKGESDFIILAGVMDRSYKPHSYANPWLFLNSNLEIISSKDYLGAGHNIIFDDVNNDGQVEIMIGYQLVNPIGEVIWTLDFWEGKEINSFEQHADFIQGTWIEGKWYGTISGSDKQYFFDSNGKSIWVKDLPHPQCSLFGKYAGQNRIFVTNQRELMNAYDLNGREIWKGILPQHWPMGKPKLLNPNRPIHSSNPINLFKQAGEKNTDDLILYKEGGWPYLIDFNGKIRKKFPITKNMRFKSNTNLFRRINDIGVSFEAEFFDFDNDGKPEVLIYNREYLWLFKI